MSAAPIRLIKDRRVFDVSLVAGHRDYLGKRSDFSVAFVRKLTKAAREAHRAAPPLHPTPPGRIHFTLRAIYCNRAPEFQHRSRRENRRRRYLEVMRWAIENGLGDVLWQGYAMTPHGVLILKGRAIGNWLSRLRRNIDRTADSLAPYPASSFCHIVLGRLSRLPGAEELRKLNHWLRAQANFKPLRMRISSPVLLVTSNHFGTDYHRDGKSELE